jgi:general secretion pathway protein J
MRTGFTLVEMLVALFIFGLLSAAGVTVMSYAARNQTVVREHTERLAEFQRMRGVLKADLAQAAPRRTRGVDGLAAPGPFSGGEGAPTGALLTLVRRGWENPDADPRASLQYVEYRVVDGQLQRAARPALDGAALGPPQTLYDGVEAAKVEFFSRGQWLSTWQPSLSNPIPQAVRVELTLRDIGPVTQLFLTPGTVS